MQNSSAWAVWLPLELEGRYFWIIIYDYFEDIYIYTESLEKVEWFFYIHSNINSKHFLGGFCSIATNFSIELKITCPLIGRISRNLETPTNREFVNFCKYFCMGSRIWWRAFSLVDYSFTVQETHRNMYSVHTLSTLHPRKCLKSLLSIILAHCQLINGWLYTFQDCGCMRQKSKITRQAVPDSRRQNFAVKKSRPATIPGENPRRL